jgi:hypothetical protein
MSADDYFDAPETPSRTSKWEKWGYKLFANGLLDANVDFLEPNASEPSIMRIAGRPIVNGATVEGVDPFLRAKPSRRLSEPAERLFGLTTCYQVRVVRYVGPAPEFDQETRKRIGPPQLHFIDEFPPDVRREYISSGRPLPQTCMDILLAKAPTTVARHPKFGVYYRPDDDFHSALRRPTNVWFLHGLCLQHGKVDCDEDDPLPAIHLLTWSSYRSLLDLVLEENDGYTYKEGATHESVSTREELTRRFKCPELTNPEGAPAVVFTSHKQKRRSSKSGKKDGRQMEGNRYVATLTPETYPFPAELQANIWNHPRELFWYPTPKEAYELLINNASENLWRDFLYHLAQGTDLETSESVRGVNAEEKPEAPASEPTPPAEEPSVNSRSEGTFDDVDSYVDDEYSADEATPVDVAVESEAPKAKTLGIGSLQKRKEEEQKQFKGESKEATPDAGASNVSMPMPDHTRVFDDSGNEAVADTPESVEERTQKARDRLAALRNKK